jgi:hypothetical protein
MAILRDTLTLSNLYNSSKRLCHYKMSHEFTINLGWDSGPKYHLPCETDELRRPMPHHQVVAGMSVTGLIPVVVHGFANDEPHTLVIFEWCITARCPDLRTTSVAIEASFMANGPSGHVVDEAEALQHNGGEKSYWGPEVIRAAPSGSMLYNLMIRMTKDIETYKQAFSADFRPYFTASPKLSLSHDDSASIVDSIKVTGHPFVVGSNRDRPNAIRWTIRENESQSSGVPAYLRTAVLLKRQPNGNGSFLGNVKIEMNVAWMEDGEEKTHKLSSQIKPDDVILFNPVVLQPSTFDSRRNELDKVDLDAEFQILSDEFQPRFWG